MRYHVKPSNRFLRDVKRMEKRNKDLDKLTTVIKIIASGEKLPDKYDDHAMTGNWKGHRDCHIEPDWVLIYRIEKDTLFLTLSRTGSHSDLI